MKPVRLQLSRRKGFDLQALSRATNGLEAINVARPSKWGNPWKIGEIDWYYFGHHNPLTRDEVIAQFRGYMEGYGRVLEPEVHLRGKNLACTCALDQPCHGDILLELSNSPKATR